METQPIDMEDSSSSLVLPDLEDLSHVTEEESHVTTATAEQIMELLDQMEMTFESGSGSGSEGVIVQCRHCTGELLVV